MASYAESLPVQERKKYVLFAYASTWFGGFADVLLDSSALLMIYFVLLNAGNSVIMFTAALTGLAQIPLLIPASSLVNRIGVKKMVTVSCVMTCTGYLIMSIAPFAKDMAQYVVLAGAAVFSLARPIWACAWYPILNDILLPEERGGFFGKMRFSYFVLTGTVFYFIGHFMGKTPPIHYLQITLAAVAILALGRTFCINQIKLSDHTGTKTDLKKAFSISVHNAPLVGFATYSCFFCLAFQAVIPLALLYLKKSLDFNADTVQKLSCLGIAGSVTGFLLYGWIQKKIKMRKMQILVHLLWVIIPAGFFCCSKGMPFLMPATGLLLFTANLVLAWFNCCFSQECLALSRPGNTAMASAFANTYYQFGNAVGRTASSVLLGHGLLAANWTWNGIVFTDFQTLFLLCAAGAALCFIFIFSLPSVISNHDNYYNP